jgi:hypothetical protein
MIATLFTMLAVFSVVGFAFAVHDAQEWCERRDYQHHRED